MNTEEQGRAGTHISRFLSIIVPLPFANISIPRSILSAFRSGEAASHSLSANPDLPLSCFDIRLWIFVFFLTSSFTLLSFFQSCMCILSRIASPPFLRSTQPRDFRSLTLPSRPSRDSLSRMYAANAKYNYNYNITVTMIVLYYLVCVHVAVLRT